MEPIEVVRRHAAKQYGVVTRRQAIELGMERHEVDTAVRNGTFVLGGSGTLIVNGSPDSWEQRAMIAALSAGPGAAISHYAAGALLGLLERKPDVIDVTTPHTKRRKGAKRARSLEASDIRYVRRIPVTCPGRTLVDLSSDATDEALEAAADEALLRGLATVDGMRRYIASRRLGSRGGVGRLQQILDDRERFGVPQKELERKMVRLLRRFNIPQAERQYPVGRRKLDFAFPELKLAIELDGRKDHSRKPVFEDDRRRQNELVLAGWTVLRFTWDEVTKRPEQVAATIRRALESAGGGT